MKKDETSNWRFISFCQDAVLERTRAQVITMAGFFAYVFMASITGDMGWWKHP